MPPAVAFLSYVASLLYVTHGITNAFHSLSYAMLSFNFQRSPASFKPKRQQHYARDEKQICNVDKGGEYCTVERDMKAQTWESKIFIKSKVTAVRVFFRFFALHSLLLVRACHDTSLLVVTHALFEEVGLTG